MAKYVQLPSGDYVGVPDDFTPAQIESALHKNFPSQFEKQGIISRAKDAITDVYHGAAGSDAGGETAASVAEKLYPAEDTAPAATGTAPLPAEESAPAPKTSVLGKTKNFVSGMLDDTVRRMGEARGSYSVMDTLPPQDPGKSLIDERGAPVSDEYAREVRDKFGSADTATRDDMLRANTPEGSVARAMATDAIDAENGNTGEDVTRYKSQRIDDNARAMTSMATAAPERKTMPAPVRKKAEGMEAREELYKENPSLAWLDNTINRVAMGTLVDIPESIMGVSKLFFMGSAVGATKLAELMSYAMPDDMGEAVRKGANKALYEDMKMYQRLYGKYDQAMAALSEHILSYRPDKYIEKDAQPYFTEAASWQSLSREGLINVPKNFLKAAFSSGSYTEKWKDMDAIWSSAVESAPLSLLTLIPVSKAAGAAGRIAEQAAIKQGLPAAQALAAGKVAATKTAAWFGAGYEGVTGAGSNFSQTYNQVYNTSPEKLLKNPNFQDTMKALPATMSEREKFETAKTIVAGRAASVSGVIAGVVDAGVAFKTDAYIGKLFGNTREAADFWGRAKGTGRAFAQGTVNEGIEELIQSPGEQFGQNVGVKLYADRTQSLSQDLGNQAVMGSLSGAASGGVQGGFANIGVNQGRLGTANPENLITPEGYQRPGNTDAWMGASKIAAERDAAKAQAMRDLTGANTIDAAIDASQRMTPSVVDYLNAPTAIPEPSRYPASSTGITPEQVDAAPAEPQPLVLTPDNARYDQTGMPQQTTVNANGETVLPPTPPTETAPAPAGYGQPTVEPTIRTQEAPFALTPTLPGEDFRQTDAKQRGLYTAPPFDAPGRVTSSSAIEQAETGAYVPRATSGSYSETRTPVAQTVAQLAPVAQTAANSTLSQRENRGQTQQVAQTAPVAQDVAQPERVAQTLSPFQEERFRSLSASKQAAELMGQALPQRLQAELDQLTIAKNGTGEAQTVPAAASAAQGIAASIARGEFTTRGERVVPVSPVQLPADTAEKNALTKSQYEILSTLMKPAGVSISLFEARANLPDAFVVPGNTNTVYLANKTTAAVDTVAYHEFTHLVQQSGGDMSRVMLDTIRQELKPSATTDAAAFHATNESMTPEQLLREINADLTGNLFHGDPEFMNRVVAKMHAQQGQTVKAFFERLAIAIREEVARVKAEFGIKPASPFGTDIFKTQDGQDIARQYVGNLERVEASIVDAMAEFYRNGAQPNTKAASQQGAVKSEQRTTALATTNNQNQPIHPEGIGIDRFWQWFSGSKTMTKDGRPIVLYHGTNADFDTFQGNGSGLYFTPDASYASDFAENTNAGGNPAVLPVYVRMTNPASEADLRSAIAESRANPEAGSRVDVLRRRGFDGAYLAGSNQYIAFDASQVKSATGNNGAFSASPSMIQSPQRADAYEMSTRNPTAVRATQDAQTELLTADYAAAKEEPNLLNSLAKAVTAYNLYRDGKPSTPDAKAITPEQKVEAFVNTAAANMGWVYDRMPDAMRETSRQALAQVRVAAGEIAQRNKLTLPQAAALIATQSQRAGFAEAAERAARLADFMKSRQNVKWDAKMTDELPRALPGMAARAEKLVGTRFSDVANDFDRGLWIIAYDAAHNSTGFDVRNEKGEVVGRALNEDGTEKALSWGSPAMVGKAVSVLRDGSAPAIHAALGNGLKTRNLFNTILLPNNPNGHVVVDAHTVEAATLSRQLDGNPEVHDVANGPGSTVTGIKGTYPLYAEALKRAAQARGVPVAEFQTAVDEGVRSMLSAAYKANPSSIGELDALWQGYKAGNVGMDTIRKALLAHGFDGTSWERLAKGSDPSGLYQTEVTASNRRDDLFNDLIGKRSRGNLNSEGNPVTFTKQGLTNFANWFGDSQTVDQKGRPLVLYHGTHADFAAFEVGRKTQNYSLFGSVDAQRHGIFLTPDKAMASQFAIPPQAEKDGAVMPVYAKISNPLDLRSGYLPDDVYYGLRARDISLSPFQSSATQMWQVFDDEYGQQFVAALKDMGYDGAVFTESIPGDDKVSDVYVAFTPSQIKSALGNRGTFASATDDVTASAKRFEPEAVSTRLPSSKKGTDETGILTTSFDAVKNNPDYLTRAVAQFERYPEIRLDPAMSVQDKAEAIIQQGKDNVLYLYDKVPPDVRKEARRWYDGADRLKKAIARADRITDAQAAGVMAALSPQKDWDMTVAMAERISEIWRTQQDTGWSAKMEETAKRLLKDNPELVATKELIRGQNLGALTSDLQRAVWIRIFDEAHRSHEYARHAPNGKVVDVAKNVDGNPTKLAWSQPSEMAKAVQILRDGSTESISNALGRNHKVRNFYNNILDPANPNFVTVDTHAVGAAMMTPTGVESPEVSDNFSGTKANLLGISGTYPFYQEMYAQAAKERGISPREMQSVVWDAGRTLFNSEFKHEALGQRGRKDIGRVDMIRQVWNDYAAGKVDFETARQAVYDITDGIGRSNWQTGEKVDPVVLFEVAPDPNNTELTARWDSLDAADKVAVSAKVANDVIPKAMRLLGVKGKVQMHVGGYEGATNPGLSIQLSDTSKAGQIVKAAKAAGYILSQESVMVTSDMPFEGGQKVGIITIDLPAGTTAQQVADIYAKIYPLDPKALTGHTTVGRTMAIVDRTGRTDEVVDKVAAELGDGFTVHQHVGYSTLIKKADYGYLQKEGRENRAAPGGRPAPYRSPVQQAIDNLQAQESELLQTELDRLESRGTAQPLGRAQEVIASEKRQAPDTEEFRRWFGNSKVVDESGKPIVMYHGTLNEFNAFQPNSRGLYFLTPSADWASTFISGEAGNTLPGKTNEGANVMPVYVRANNPFDFANAKHVNAVAVAAGLSRAAISEIRKGAWSRIEDRTTLQAIKSLGFDGVYVQEGGVKNLAVFSPDQIKSVTGNNGQFDDTNPDITASDKRNPDVIPPETAIQRQERYSIDRMSRFATLKNWAKERGIAIPEAADVWLHQKAEYGKAYTANKKFAKEEMAPLLSDMKKSDVAVGYVDQALMSGSAPNPVIDGYAQRLKAMDQVSLQMLADTGYGLPKGVSATPTSVADVQYHRELALMAQARSAMDRSLISMAIEINDPQFAEITAPVKREFTRGQTASGVYVKGQLIAAFNDDITARDFVVQDSTQNQRNAADYTVQTTTDPFAVAMAEPRIAANEVAAYIGGHEVRVKINDEIALREYKKRGVHGLDTFMKAFATGNRFLAQSYTGYSPEFWVVNPIRDFTVGMFNLVGNEGFAFAGKAAANYPVALRELGQSLYSGKNTGWVQRFEDAGVPTGGAWVPDIDRVKADIDRIYAKTGKFDAKEAVGYFTNISAITEGAMRLATYKTAIESGYTELKAAQLAKDVTIDFNQMGEKSSQENAFWLFFHANAVGAATFVNTLLRGQYKGKAWGVGGMLAMAGFLAGMAGAASDPDRWDRIPDELKYKKVVVMGKEKDYTMDIGYGVAIFWATGMAVAELMRGKDRSEVAKQWASSLLDNLMPLNPMAGGATAGSFWTTITPTALSIPLRHAMNRSSFGRKIVPDSEWDKGLPDSQKMWKSTEGTAWAKAAANLNRAGGGDEYEAAKVGAMDISPETMKYYWQSIFGGAGRFVTDVAGAAYTKMKGGEVETANTPFARRFTREETVSDYSRQFNERRVKVEEAKGRLSRADKKDDPKAYSRLDAKYGKLIDLDRELVGVAADLKDIRLRQTEIMQDEKMPLALRQARMKALREEEKAVYRDFDKVWRETFPEQEKRAKSPLNAK